MIHYECPVTEITTSDKSVTVAYSKGGAPQTITADFCICTMPIPILAKTRNNFSPEANAAFTGMPMAAAYKIAWESPRFWEKENHIYGGISFLKNTVDLVWYPSAKLFSPTGVLISGFNIERNEAGFGKAFGDSAGGLTLHSERFPLSRPSSTLPGRRWKRFTPAARSCWRSQSTSAG